MLADQEITREWQIAYKDLTDWIRIGGGNFGKVFRATYRGAFVAVKELINPDKGTEQEDDMDIYYQREMATLKELQHKNVVQLLGLCKYEETLFIITEFVDGGDLRRHLKNKNLKMTWALRVRIAMDCASAMAYLHSKSILHRDMKSKNLLVGPDWGVKVCDFGFARKMAPQNEYMTLCGTDEWMAPEVMLGEKYDEKADVYSFGMVLVEIITRAKPIERVSPSTPYDYERLKAMTPPSCPYELFKVCILCSQFYPINRLTIFEALEMLRALNQSIQNGEVVKTISDIQQEMAAMAAQEEADSSEGENGQRGDDDSSAGSGGDTTSSSKEESEADDERLAVQVREMREVEVEELTFADDDVGIAPHVSLNSISSPVSPAQQQSPGGTGSLKSSSKQQQLGQQRFVRAVKDNVATDSVELSFSKGDEIQFGSQDDSGWVFGTLRGQSGWFRRENVEEIPAPGLKPLFPDQGEDEAVVSSPIRKEDAISSLEKGILNRPTAASLENKGILKQEDVTSKKDKKLTLGLLFSKVGGGGGRKTAEQAEITLGEPELDALILALADEKQGPEWGRQKKVLGFRSYEHTCPGSGLQTWIVQRGLARDEKEAIMVLEQLLARGALIDPASRGKKIAFDRSQLYQLALRCIPEDSPVLNKGKICTGGMTEAPAELCYSMCKNVGSFFKPAPKDPAALLVNVQELQSRDRIVFLSNLHNCITMHARAVFGAPTNMLERKRNLDAGYLVGGHVLNCQVITEKLLRGKIEPEDPLYALVAKVSSPFALLSLSDGTLSYPRPRAYSEKTWSDDLAANVHAWLSTKDIVSFNQSMNTLTLPRVFKTYLDDFGGQDAMIQAIYPHMSEAAKEFIDDIRNSGAGMDVKFIDHVFASW